MCRGPSAGQIAEYVGFYTESEKAFRMPAKQRKLVAPIPLWLVLNRAVARDDRQQRWHPDLAELWRPSSPIHRGHHLVDNPVVPHLLLYAAFSSTSIRQAFSVDLVLRLLL